MNEKFKLGDTVLIVDNMYDHYGNIGIIVASYISTHYRVNYCRNAWNEFIFPGIFNMIPKQGADNILHKLD